VFVSSHLMNEMAVTAEHLIVIGRGRLVADCSTEEFIERGRKQTVLVRTPDAERLTEALALVGSVDGLVTCPARRALPGFRGAVRRIGRRPVGSANDLLTPWQGFGVFCLWTAVLLVAAAILLRRRDA
jgi:hypothetical protein